MKSDISVVLLFYVLILAITFVLHHDAFGSSLRCIDMKAYVLCTNDKGEQTLIFKPTR